MRSRNGLLRFEACLFWAAICATLLTWPLPAWAHHLERGHVSSRNGLFIPNLSHGQMFVIADNKAAILDLAGRLASTDPTLSVAAACSISPGLRED